MNEPRGERWSSGALHDLEDRLESAYAEKRAEIRYRIINGKVRFAESARRQHQALRRHALPYLLHGRPLAVLTAPFVYVLLVPFVLLDGLVCLYQRVCFPIYGIPRVKRSDYYAFDRQHLAYLNGFEKLNCLYCAYGNGLLAFVTEVAARTEQHWCPIRHARDIRSPHSRYDRFLDFGDAEAYRARLDQVRGDFGDLARVDGSVGE